MFKNCSSLTSLDLSNFDTSNVKKMHYMFAHCSSLTSLNLSYFITLKVTNVSSVFYNCSSFTSLDLSNFDTSNVTEMEHILYRCINLEYINIYKFKEINLNSCNNIFTGVPENIVICIDENNIQDKNLSQISNIKLHTISCSNNWKSIQKKIINNTNECINSCKISNQYEYNGKCYENCSNGDLYDNNNKLNKCKCELDKCLTCPQVALNKKLCTKCNINYYPKKDDLLNLGEYINCYNETEDGYYLVIQNKLYKKCYESCKT